jgi:hypothetical protein
MRFLENRTPQTSSKVLQGWLVREDIANGDGHKMRRDTYETLCQLHEEGRNHIWGYVARNLPRPVWLATEAQKADIVIGNPPWLAYSMGGELKQRFNGSRRYMGRAAFCLWI